MNLANGGRVSSWMSECPFRLADYDSTDSAEIVYVLFFFLSHQRSGKFIRSLELETIFSLVNHRNNNFIKYIPHLSLSNLFIFLSKHAREYRYSTFLNLRIYRSLGIKKYLGNKVFYFCQNWRVHRYRQLRRLDRVLSNLQIRSFGIINIWLVQLILFV